MSAKAGRASDSTKQLLLEAGEHLFASKGIHGVTLRELNERAGQRNSSALHYHFGARDGLVLAILEAQQVDVDEAMDLALNATGIGRGASVHEILDAVVPGVAAKLLTPRGRDFLRIVPQIMPDLSRSLRAGQLMPSTQTAGRVMSLLDRALADMPAPIRVERLVAYVIVLTTMLAERAQAIAEDQPLGLDHNAFVENLVSMLTGALTAPAPLGTSAGESV